jgi:hypothetical protein
MKNSHAELEVSGISSRAALSRTMPLDWQGPANTIAPETAGFHSGETINTAGNND